jgi:hypothetical protein
MSTQSVQAYQPLIKPSVPAFRPPVFTPIPGLTLQRQACESCEDDLKKKGQSLQRFPASSSWKATGSLLVPGIVHEVLDTSGQPLDVTTQVRLEPRFNHDFSRVRVHTDRRAAESARQVNALAYTVGQHIVFDSGQYAPGTSRGSRLLAHELSHVVQQSRAGAPHGQLSMGAPDDTYEQEAHEAADRLLQNQPVQVQRFVTHSLERSLQRELATPEPAVAPAAQPDLTDEQIQQAIAFNRTRYNAVNTRLIQSLLGGPVTGEWTEENIQAIAANQEIYGLKKDGKVGDETFRFLNREARLEGMSTSTANCLTMFRIIGPDAPTFRRVDSSHCHVEGHFRTESQFSSRCNCSQFQFRQFIRGHFTRNRGGTITDISSIFSRLPSGSLTAAFQEDGDTTDTPVNYGHRDQDADDDPIDHYINNAGDDDQANGCRYLSEDGPDATINDCRAGDSYEVDMNFRGEIQRNGTAIQQKFWTAFRNNNWRP